MNTFKKKMGRKLVVVFLLTSSLFTSVKPVNAISAVTGIVFDIPNTIQGTISAIAEVTSTATAIMQRVNMLMGPWLDALKLAKLAKEGNLIRNLVVGSMGTNNALLITNPKQYLTNQGKASIRESLKNVEDAKGVYSDAISGDEIRAARMKYDSKAQLTAISHSGRPAVIQKNLCSDDDLVKLTELAGEDGPQDPKYNTRREELYEKLCDGDPAEDPELSKALLALDSQNPSVGGWNSFLTATQEGGSAVAKMRASVVIATNEQAKVAAKAADLTMGKGISSQSECGAGNKDLQEDGAGNTFCPDGKELIAKLGSHVSETYTDALNSTNNVLRNSLGQTTPFIALVQNLTSLLNTTNSTISTFSDAINDSSTRRTVATSTGNITYSTSTYTHTLTPGTGTHTTITTNLKTSLNDDKNSLVTLQKIDSEFSGLVNGYLSTLTTTKNCFDSLIAEFPDETIRQTHFNAISTNSEVIAALAYLNPELSSTQTLRAKINNDLSGISTMQTLINTTLDKIAKSDSIEEITDLYDKYTETTRIQKLPTSQTAIERVQEKGEFQQKIGDGSMDKAEAIKKIEEITVTCASVGTRERSARNDARSVN